jgi:hypothetical protein
MRYLGKTREKLAQAALFGVLSVGAISYSPMALAGQCETDQALMNDTDNKIHTCITADGGDAGGCMFTNPGHGASYVCGANGVCEWCDGSAQCSGPITAGGNSTTVNPNDPLCSGASGGGGGRGGQLPPGN